MAVDGKQPAWSINIQTLQKMSRLAVSYKFLAFTVFYYIVWELFVLISWKRRFVF